MYKKEVYIAFDDTEFPNRQACIDYEAFKRKELQNKYNELPLKQQYNIVKEEFEYKANIKSLPNSYLITHGYKPRENGIGGDIIAEHDYGIIHLRDDGVEVLLAYIKELEGRK